MKELRVIVYTMKGCPFCEDYKKMLQEENIEFVDRDIDEFEDEYSLFVEVSDSELIPAMLIIESEDEDYESFIYVPDQDYTELKEALEIVKHHRQRLLD